MLTALLGLIGTAMAADHPCDAAYEPACVDPSATVHVDAEIQDYASVGPGVSLGDVVVGARAQIAGPTAQTVGDGTTIGRRAIIGSGADISTDVAIGRAVQVGQDFTAGAWATIGYASQAGDRLTLGGGAAVGSLVTLGDDVTIDGIVARSSTLGDRTQVGGIVGPGVTIGADAVVDGRLRKEATLADGVVVASGARVGRDAQLGYGVEIDAGASVSANATVPACAWLADGVRVRRGDTFEGPTVDGCYDPDALLPFEVRTVSGGEAHVTGVSTDPVTGDVFIIGTFNREAIFDGATLTSTNTGGSDVFVARFEGDGTLVWARSYVGVGESRGGHIAYYNGSLYVTGDVDGSLTFDGQTLSNEDAMEESFIARIDAVDGDRVWMREIQTNTTSNSNRINDIAVSSSGVYLVGSFNNTVDFLGSGGRSMTSSTGNNDGFFARISSSGSWQTVKQMGGDGLDWLGGVTVLPNGNVAMGGLVGSNTLTSGTNWLGGGYGEGADMDAILIIVNGSGSQVSARVISGPGTNQIYDLASAGSYLVATMQYANSLSFGSSSLSGGPSSNGMALLRFNTSGSPLRAWDMGGAAYMGSGSLVTDGTRAVVAGWTASEAASLGGFPVGIRSAFAASITLSTGSWEWVTASSGGNNPRAYDIALHDFNGESGYVFAGDSRDTTTFGPYTLTPDDGYSGYHGFWFPLGSDGSL